MYFCSFKKYYPMRVYFIIIFCFFCFALPKLQAQRISAGEYINMYKNIAISEMKRSGIPASITLAQGMLESGNGNSRLTVAANNHFGIKCHTWTGEKVYFDDDKQGECFRKYDNPDESFVDHSDFLMKNSRYSFLFDYESTDYTSWAKGLSQAGYATDPNYSQKLIQLIENHDLSQYDTGVSTPKKEQQSIKNQKKSTNSEDFAPFHIDGYDIKENNRTSYIIAKSDDSYASLSKELDMMPWQLPRYNEAKPSEALQEGQIVYLQPKRRTAEKGKDKHTVGEGETMYSISQKYAIKVARLYTLNRMEIDTQPEAGAVLNLRKKIKNNQSKINKWKLQDNKK